MLAYRLPQDGGGGSGAAVAMDEQSGDKTQGWGAHISCPLDRLATEAAFEYGWRSMQHSSRGSIGVECQLTIKDVLAVVARDAGSNRSVGSG